MGGVINAIKYGIAESYMNDTVLSFNIRSQAHASYRI